MQASSIDSNKVSRKTILTIQSLIMNTINADMGSSFGQMEVHSRDIGLMVKLAVLECSERH